MMPASFPATCSSYRSSDGLSLMWISSAIVRYGRHAALDGIDRRPGQIALEHLQERRSAVGGMEPDDRRELRAEVGVGALEPSQGVESVEDRRVLARERSDQEAVQVRGRPGEQEGRAERLSTAATPPRNDCSGERLREEKCVLARGPRV